MWPFFILVFKFFYEIYKEFLVYLIARLNLVINEKSRKCWYEVNDKVWGSIGGGVEVVRKCLGRCGEDVTRVWGEVSVERRVS